MMPSRGVLYMMLSALGFSAMSVLVKVAAETLPTGEIVLARAVVTLDPVVPDGPARRASPVGQRARPARVPRPARVRRARLLLRRARRDCRSPTRRRCRTRCRSSPRCSRGGCSRERVGRATAFALACGLAGVLLVMHPSGDRWRSGRARARRSARRRAVGDRVRHRAPARAHRASARHRVLLSARRDAARVPVGGRQLGRGRSPRELAPARRRSASRRRSARCS